MDDMFLLRCTDCHDAAVCIDMLGMIMAISNPDPNPGNDLGYGLPAMPLEC